MLGRAGQFKFLGQTGIAFPSCDNLFFGWLFIKADENGGEMSVRSRNAYALRGDGRTGNRNDNAVLYSAPYLHRFAFALFFFASDIRDYVVDYFRPVGKGLPGSGNSLICGDSDLIRRKRQKRAEHRHIALYGAVRLYTDKAVFCA
ncbi:hypothetical protein SDC9_184450 [bioreactor metagenome]|uniref:Uncharacterized protein n=1 Tax=bioreactor metagenome TaxID=1076179 RepID=A0A645HD27_9ZZZZ